MGIVPHQFPVCEGFGSQLTKETFFYDEKKVNWKTSSSSLIPIVQLYVTWKALELLLKSFLCVWYSTEYMCNPTEITPQSEPQTPYPLQDPRSSPYLLQYPPTEHAGRSSPEVINPTKNLRRLHFKLAVSRNFQIRAKKGHSTSSLFRTFCQEVGHNDQNTRATEERCNPRYNHAKKKSSLSSSFMIWYIQ